MALNYTAIEALTRKKYIPNLVDNIFNSTPFMRYLKDRQKTYDGGRKIVQPLIYGELSGVKSYDAYDQMVYDTSIPITAAEFTPKNIAAPFIISKVEELQNMGESQVLDLVESKMKILEETLRNDFSDQLYGDGTGNNSKDLDGLAALFSESNTYGGISRSTYSWWRPKIHDNSGSNRTLTEKLLVDTFVDVSDGEDTPDVILTGKNGWTQYYLLVKGRITVYTESVKKALGLGFQTLEFMGRPIIMDKNIDETGGVSYKFLNMQYLQLRPHQSANFTDTKFRPDDSRLATKKEILWSGNLTCSNCRRQAELKDISPTGITS